MLPPAVMPVESDDGWSDADEADDADFAEEAAAPYALQIASIHTPIPEFIGDTAARLVVEVTVMNAGRDSAPIARLSLDETDGTAHRPTHEILVPRIAPGQSVTIRVPVAFPTNPDGMICVGGKVEPLVSPEAPRRGLGRHQERALALL